jgi:hypothetical protein
MRSLRHGEIVTQAAARTLATSCVENPRRKTTTNSPAGPVLFGYAARSRSASAKDAIPRPARRSQSPPSPPASTSAPAPWRGRRERCRPCRKLAAGSPPDRNDPGARGLCSQLIDEHADRPTEAFCAETARPSQGRWRVVGDSASRSGSTQLRRTMLRHCHDSVSNWEAGFHEPPLEGGSPVAVSEADGSRPRASGRGSRQCRTRSPGEQPGPRQSREIRAGRRRSRGSVGRCGRRPPGLVVVTASSFLWPSLSLRAAAAAAKADSAGQQ